MEATQTQAETKIEKPEEKIKVLEKVVKIRKQKLLDSYFITLPINLVKMAGIDGDNVKNYMVKYIDYDTENKIVRLTFIKVG
jgi:hypothetical protein